MGDGTRGGFYFKRPFFTPLDDASYLGSTTNVVEWFASEVRMLEFLLF
jgi:hypothetical protein